MRTEGHFLIRDHLPSTNKARYSAVITDNRLADAKTSDMGAKFDHTHSIPSKLAFVEPSYDTCNGDCFDTSSSDCA